MVLTDKQMLQLWREDALEEDGVIIFELVEDGEWNDGGKYQSKEVIVRELATDKHFAYGITRSGSYFSSYEYEADGDIEEVQKVTETITVEKWVQV